VRSTHPLDAAHRRYLAFNHHSRPRDHYVGPASRDNLLLEGNVREVGGLVHHGGFYPPVPFPFSGPVTTRGGRVVAVVRYPVYRIAYVYRLSTLGTEVLYSRVSPPREDLEAGNVLSY